MFTHFSYLVKGNKKNETTGSTQSINLLLDICCAYFYKDFYYVVCKQHSHARWVDWNIKHVSQKKLLLGQ